jgi:hypothetical protein
VSGHQGKGLAAWISTGLLIILVRLFWEYARTTWIWIVSCAGVITNSVIIALWNFRFPHIPTIIIAAPLAFVGFLLYFFIFFFLAQETEKGRRPGART